MISPSEAYTFIDTNAAILANSGIKINVDRVKNSVKRGTFTKRDFLSYIEDEISNFIYQWSYSSDIRNSFDLNLLIIKVQKSGKDFKYIFLKDIDPFKTLSVESIQQGLEDSLLINFSNGEIYRMAFPFRSSCFNKGKVLLTRIKNLPDEFDAADLKETIIQILTPVLEFQHEDEDTTIFMKNEFLKLIPFENHAWITREEESQILNWEYCIMHGPWTLSRDRVKIILNMFLSALNKYSDDSSAPKGWCEVVNNTISSITSLMSGTLHRRAFVNQSQDLD